MRSCTRSLISRWPRPSGGGWSSSDSGRAPTHSIVKRPSALPFYRHWSARRTRQRLRCSGSSGRRRWVNRRSPLSSIRTGSKGSTDRPLAISPQWSKHYVSENYSASAQRSPLPQFPGTAEDRIVGRSGTRRFIGGEEIDFALAEAQGFGFELGVDLGVDGAKHDLLDRVADHDVAMTAHQHDGRRAPRFADLEDRHAGAEKRAHVVDRPQRNAGRAKGNDRRRMAVHDRPNLGIGLVDLAVNKSLDIERAPARVEGVAVEVEFHDVVRCDETRRHAARQQKACCVLLVPRADMPKAVDHALVGEDAVGGDEIVDLVLIRSLLRP